MPELLFGFDLDGTLFRRREGVQRVPYEDGEGILASTEPIPGAVGRVKLLGEFGWPIAYVSGRSVTVRDATLRQIREAGLPVAPLYLQDKWRGYAVMIDHKRRALLDAGAVLYVGDHDADLEAAAEAGAAFMHADDWDAGELTHHLFCRACGCTVFRACSGGCTWSGPYNCSRCTPTTDDLEVYLHG